jgi:putative phosphoesterase
VKFAARASASKSAASFPAPERRTLRLGPEGTLRLAVVADTHSSPHPDAARHLAARAPDAILHGGDIGDLEVLQDLAAIAPVIAVRGNIDAATADVPEHLVLAIEDGDATLFTLLLTHIAVAGPRIRADAARLAQREGASLVVCGHSHVPFIGRDRGLVVFNPGSIGPRRFALPIVFGMLELGRERLDMHHVDCETGDRWTPP